MPTLAELRAENDRIEARTKQLLEDFPGASWGPKQQTEWDTLMNRAEQLKGEFAAQDTALKNAANSSPWKNQSGGDVKVLRNSADIRAHYAAMNNTGRPGEEIRIDDFLRGVAGMKSSTAVQNALSTGTDTAGGYLLPSVVMPGILEALVPASSLLSAGAGIVPLDAGARNFTTAAIDTIPTAQWRLESGQIATSEATFRAVVAAPKSLAFMFKVSRELLADAPNMAAALNVAIGQAFAKELDRVGLRGSGTAPEPHGILTTSGIQTMGNGANGKALADYANFLSAAETILQADAPAPLAAIMSPRSLIRLAGLVDGNKQPLAPPRMLENWKMLSTSQIPNNLSVGTSSDCSEIYVGDFSKVNFMMREQVSIQIARELFAGTGEVGFICHVRADVAVMYPKAIAVITGVR
ncbi:phage major capsid protein [Massilia sp. TN1-12]|uniref:phage major capsid protein n=1 Tax=Massilia paldalensis TaxID=3377675 RepID=UPI00384F4580